MEIDPQEQHGRPVSAGWRTALGPPGPARRDDTPRGPRMLDITNGPARLMFESSSGRRYRGRLDRWLAVLRTGAPPGGAVRLVWVLDARTIQWPGGLPPAELYRGATGLNSEEAPVLCFNAVGEERRGRRGAVVPGVFGANGIMDAASARIRASRIRGRVRLSVRIDTDMWALSFSTARNLWSTAPVRHLTISVSGAPRPLELQAVARWL